MSNLPRIFLALWLAFMVALAVTVGVSVSAFGQGFNGGGFNVGNGPFVGGGGGCTTTTFAQDGTSVAAHSSSASALTSPSFSTSFCNDLIVVVAGNNNNGICSLTDSQSRLSFTRNVKTGPTGAGDFEIWTAPLSGSALSGDTITATWCSGVQFVNMAVIAFSGYKTSAPFDPNAAIPNAAPTGSCSWTTSNANDILIGGSFTNSTTPDSGFSMITNATNSFFFAEYQLVSATQSGLTATQLNSESACTAIQKGP